MVMDLLQAQQQRKVRQLLLSYGSTVHINLHESPAIDRYGVVTFADWGGWLLQVMPMIFNDRLVLTPMHCLAVIDYGWCYPKGGAAYFAALVWDPANEGEPVGYIKATAPWRRQSGEQAR